MLHRPFARGFTLIELLLVVAIFLLVAGMAVPMFTGSFAGAKLRTSVRSVVMVHRYARSLAVLRHRPAAVRVHKETRMLDVILLTGREDDLLTELNLADADDEQDRMPASAEEGMDAWASDISTEAADVATIELRRSLEQGITVDAFESQRPGSEQPDAPLVSIYYPSGLCDGFMLRLRDERGRTADITADALTGEIKVVYPES